MKNSTFRRTSIWHHRRIYQLKLVIHARKAGIQASWYFRVLGLVEKLLMILPALAGLDRQSRYFFLLSQEKVSKKKATPSHFPLRCSSLWAAIGNSLRSNSRLPKTPIKIALLGMAAGDKVMQVEVGDWI
jgi:hypothetical protein